MALLQACNTREGNSSLGKSANQRQASTFRGDRPGTLGMLVHHSTISMTVCPSACRSTSITLKIATTYMFPLPLMATSFGCETSLAGKFFKIAHQHCCTYVPDAACGWRLGHALNTLLQSPQQFRKSSRQLPLWAHNLRL